MVLGGLSGLVIAMQASVWLRSHEHGHGPAWMGYPGFFFVFGILGAVLLAGFAKLIVFPLLKRGEDYYEEKQS